MQRLLQQRRDPPMNIEESLWTRRMGRSSANQRSPGALISRRRSGPCGPATRWKIRPPRRSRTRSAAPPDSHPPGGGLVGCRHRAGQPSAELAHRSAVAGWPGVGIAAVSRRRGRVTRRNWPRPAALRTVSVPFQACSPRWASIGVAFPRVSAARQSARSVP